MAYCQILKYRFENENDNLISFLILKMRNRCIRSTDTTCKDILIVKIFAMIQFLQSNEYECNFDIFSSQFGKNFCQTIFILQDLYWAKSVGRFFKIPSTMYLNQIVSSFQHSLKLKPVEFLSNYEVILKILSTLLTLFDYESSQEPKELVQILYILLQQLNEIDNKIYVYKLRQQRHYDNASKSPLSLSSSIPADSPGSSSETKSPSKQSIDITQTAVYISQLNIGQFLPIPPPPLPPTNKPPAFQKPKETKESSIPDKQKTEDPLIMDIKDFITKTIGLLNAKF